MAQLVPTNEQSNFKCIQKVVIYIARNIWLCKLVKSNFIVDNNDNTDKSNPRKKCTVYEN